MVALMLVANSMLTVVLVMILAREARRRRAVEKYLRLVLRRYRDE